MQPWSYIIAGLGWLIVGLVALFALAVVAGIAIRAWRLASFYRLHYRTRGIAPAAGQRWLQDRSTTLTIKSIVADGPNAGRIVMSSGCASWSDSPEEWRERVRSRRLVLIEEA